MGDWLSVEAKHPRRPEARVFRVMVSHISDINSSLKKHACNSIYCGWYYY